MCQPSAHLVTGFLRDIKYLPPPAGHCLRTVCAGTGSSPAGQLTVTSRPALYRWPNAVSRSAAAGRAGARFKPEPVSAGRGRAARSVPAPPRRPAGTPRTLPSAALRLVRGERHGGHRRFGSGATPRQATSRRATRHSTPQHASTRRNTPHHFTRRRSAHPAPPGSLGAATVTRRRGAARARSRQGISTAL